MNASTAPKTRKRTKNENPATSSALRRRMKRPRMVFAVACGVSVLNPPPRTSRPCTPFVCATPHQSSTGLRVNNLKIKYAVRSRKYFTRFYSKDVFGDVLRITTVRYNTFCDRFSEGDSRLYSASLQSISPISLTLKIIQYCDRNIMFAEFLVKFWESPMKNPCFRRSQMAIPENPVKRFC